ncbi:MAG: helix-turn-helix transcriptional regulator [Flammeovirgaceae bacterium]
MPVNRNALIRYKTIDQCLRNRFRKWTLDDLIEACSDALYEYEGIDKGVSKRTVQMDLQLMRSDKLGYNAPIVVKDRKYYTYEDPDYSITNIPLTDQDLSRLSEVVEILKQFKGFSHFRELDGMVQKLEDKVFSAKNQTQSIIDFEKNEGLKGLEHLEAIYQAILKKKAIEIVYQSFKAKQPQKFDFHPQLLKEYRNRWFVLGQKKPNKPMMTLALDRIHSIDESIATYLENEDFAPQEFYKDVIGVTVSENVRPQEVRLFITNYHAPYVLTKPLHSTQKVINKSEDGVEISIIVQLNFELEREILGFGEGIKVLSPQKLADRVFYKLKKAASRYE